MNIYFDTEFTGLHKDTTLISIGLVDEAGDTFYAEFNDYDDSQVNDWIRKNVIYNLYFNKNKLYTVLTSQNGKSTMVCGNKKDVSKKLLIWLDKYKKIQFISDVCHYDFVLLIDLLYGNALNIPNNVSPYCHDINQDIANYYNITDIVAFNESRESISHCSGDKHNSLHDAKVIKDIYEKIS